MRLRVSHVPDLQSGAVATGPLTVIYPGRASRPVMLFFCPLRAYQRSTDRQFYIKIQGDPHLLSAFYNPRGLIILGQDQTGSVLYKASAERILYYPV